MFTRPHKWSRQAVCFGLAFLFIPGFYLFADLRRIDHGKRGDFLHFFYAAKALHSGQDPYSAWEGGYIYPPLMAFLYRPVTGFNEVTAVRIVLVVNILLVIAAVAIAARAYRNRLDPGATWPPITAVMFLAALANLDKIKLELQMWQTNVEVFLLFCLGLLWMDEQPILAGIALGFGFNIKYLTLPMLPYLALRRRWKVLGSFVPSIAFFALLPALQSGWHQNLRNLSVAYSGLFHLLGLPGLTTQSANIEPIDAFWSVSITSGAFAHRFGPGVPPMLVIGTGVAVFVAAVILIYRQHQVPLIAWPNSQDQLLHPWPARMAIEWTGLIVFTLAFSPQTNTAHLFNALAVTTPAAVLVLSKNSSTLTRAILIIGVAVMIAGFSLPPGNFDNVAAARRVMNWKRAGGPCWCFLAAYLALLWASMRPRVQPASESEYTRATLGAVLDRAVPA